MKKLLAALALAAAGAAGAAGAFEPRSGYDFLLPETRALQDDEFANPGMLWVQEGEGLWQAPAGKGIACAGCHGDARQSMRGAAARHPRIDPALGRPVNLEQRINRCRERQGAAPFPYESRELLALTAFVAYQSRGMPVAVDDDGPARPFVEAGRRRYFARMGQLNLACAHCHDAHWGRQLRGEIISQGQPNAFPAYRLEWQAFGSLHRRLRSCLAGVRAEPWPSGSPELVELEFYLAQRARGLPVEAPGVRR